MNKLILSRNYEEEVAEKLIQFLKDNSHRRGIIVLGGGNTPRKINEYLVSITLNQGLQTIWRNHYYVLSDERGVALSDERSNFRMLNESLFKPLNIVGSVLSFQTSLPPLKASIEFEKKLHSLLQETGVLLSLLGVGVDGHTASLFPGDKILDSLNFVELANMTGPEGLQRLTLTPKVLKKSKNIWFLANSSQKLLAVLNSDVISKIVSDHPDTVILTSS